MCNILRLAPLAEHEASESHPICCVHMCAAGYPLTLTHRADGTANIHVLFLLHFTTCIFSFMDASEIVSFTGVLRAAHRVHNVDLVGGSVIATETE